MNQAAQPPLFIDLEWTPNPNTIKLVANRTLLARGVANFKTVAEAAPSALARELLGVPGVAGVMFGQNFITLTKAEDGDWVEIHEKAIGFIKPHLEAEKPVLEGPLPEVPRSAGGGQAAEVIQQILDNEIRPAVAMDGGDITFEKYENGVLYLHMKGSCSGCPSSTMTLRMGIENRLRQVIPDLKEIIPV